MCVKVSASAPHHHPLLRPIVLAFLLLLPLARADVASPVLAINHEAATAGITVQSLRGKLNVVMGSGGNIGVYAGAQGRLLVDAGIAVSRPRLSAALDRISTLPIDTVIDTHYHWDHTDGNAWLHEAGATIIAHENTLKHLKNGTRVIEWGYVFPPSPAAGLPTVLVDREKTLPYDGETIILRHYGAGHTDSDLSVLFKKADVLFTGDLWWNGHYPFIDNGAGGSINGAIFWVDALIKAAGPNTIIVPGHGDVGDRKQLIEFRRMLVTIRHSVSQLKKQGKTLAEVVAARPSAEFDARYGDFVIDPAFFTQLVYMGV